MKKRFLSILLAVLLMLGTAIPVSAASIPFRDVPSNSWYRSAVEYCYTNGLMMGNSATEFTPEQAVTRAMMVQTLYKLSGDTVTDGAVARLPFADVVKSQWYAKAVAWAYDFGVTSGTSATAFSPKASITREQAATMLYNYHRKTAAADTSSAKAAAFSDYGKISSYARTSMAWAVNYGLLSGVGGNRLDPQGTATRAQLAQILMSYSKRQNAANDTGTDTEEKAPGGDKSPGKQGPTEEEVYAILISMKDEYYEGRPWTDANSYSWNGGIYKYGMGCVAFAFLMSDAAFGNLPARMIKPVSLEDVRVGDILRINNDTHSVIVLEVRQDSVVVAEGNFNSSIHWGRTLSKSVVESATNLMTRYPE